MNDKSIMPTLDLARKLINSATCLSLMLRNKGVPRFIVIPAHAGIQNNMEKVVNETLLGIYSGF